MTDTITLWEPSGQPREVGVGDEVVIVGRDNELSISEIAGITKATVKTNAGTFTRKSLREYGTGDSWRYSVIHGMHPDKARELIAQKQTEDKRKRARYGLVERIKSEQDNLTLCDIAAIVAILDEAAARKEDAE